MRRVVLAVLLVLCLMLLTVSYRNGNNALRGPQMVVVEAVAPIERGLTRAWQPVADAWDWTMRLFHASAQNPRLKQRVDELETQLATAKVVEAENSRLRDALALKERGTFPNGYTQVMGTVIARSPTAVDRSIVINLGSDDGVSVDDPVMVTRGLVGRVEAVSPNAARVALVINRAQAVSATVVGSDATGVLRPISNEGSPVMELAYVSQRVRVSKNDVVVTSGWSTGDLRSIYPRGIPLGVVSSVGNSPADLYKTVQVTPFADFDRIDEVIVLVPTGDTRSREAFVEPKATPPDPAPTRRGPTTAVDAQVARSRVPRKADQ